MSLYCELPLSIPQQLVKYSTCFRKIGRTQVHERERNAGTQLTEYHRFGSDVQQEKVHWNISFTSAASDLLLVFYPLLFLDQSATYNMTFSGSAETLCRGWAYSTGILAKTRLCLSVSGWVVVPKRNDPAPGYEAKRLGLSLSVNTSVDFCYCFSLRWLSKHLKRMVQWKVRKSKSTPGEVWEQRFIKGCPSEEGKKDLWRLWFYLLVKKRLKTKKNKIK